MRIAIGLRRAADFSAGVAIGLLPRRAKVERSLVAGKAAVVLDQDNLGMVPLADAKVVAVEGRIEPQVVPLGKEPPSHVPIDPGPHTAENLTDARVPLLACPAVLSSSRAKMA